MAAKRIRVSIGDQVVAVESLAPDQVRVETDAERDARIVPLANESGAYRVEIDGRGRAVYVAGPPNRRWVFCEGRVYLVTVEAEGRARTARVAHGDSLSAPMPATVVSIAAAAGDRVKHGDTVLTLEAMKMEMPIRAPHDGVIARIHCRVGDLVQPDVPLVDFE